MPSLPAVLDQAELDARGWTVVRGLLDSATCATLTAHMDSLIAARQLRTDGYLEGHNKQEGDSSEASPPRSALHGLRHPIPGRVMADVLADERCLDVATQLMRCPLDQLRLNEQVLIRTDTSEDTGEGGGENWHVDWGFLHEQYEATPRGTYFHMVTMLSTVKPGGGCFTIVPQSCAPLAPRATFPPHHWHPRRY
jgi:hypothetical protein